MKLRSIAGSAVDHGLQGLSNLCQPIAQSDDHVIAVWLPFNPFVEFAQRGFCRSAAISAASKVTAVDRWVARTNQQRPKDLAELIGFVKLIDLLE